MLDQVLARLARRIAIEAREPVLDIGGVADLAHLAVADDVHADFDLLADDVDDRIGDHAIGVWRNGAVALAGEQHVGDSLRARQAADMRGEYPVGASKHVVALRSSGTCCWSDGRRRASA